MSLQHDTRARHACTHTDHKRATPHAQLMEALRAPVLNDVATGTDTHTQLAPPLTCDTQLNATYACVLFTLPDFNLLFPRTPSIPPVPPGKCAGGAHHG